MREGGRKGGEGEDQVAVNVLPLRDIPSQSTWTGGQS